MNYRLLPLLLLLIFPPAWSATLTAEGYGPTNSDARRNALGALSESLKVEVKSYTASAKNDQGLIYAKQVKESSSELPLLATQFSYIDLGKEQHCTVTMDKAEALTQYQRQIDKRAQEITALEQQQRQQQNDARYHTLQQLYEKLDQIDDYITVALLLGEPRLPKLPTTLQQTANALRTLESHAPTVAIAAGHLTRDLPAGRYFIEPALAYGSRQATPLGRLLQSRLEAELTTTRKRQQADYILQGQYEPLKQTISVTYRAVDQKGVNRATRQSLLAASAYKDIPYQPDDIAYDQLLQDGMIEANTFQAAISTNYGKEALAFREGEIYHILVKLNRPGYFYIVGHIRNQLSYLLEINPIGPNEPNENRFIVSVDASQVNRWIDIAPRGYRITPPLGTEDLQLIASTERPQLPPYNPERQPDYYFHLKAKDAKQAVQKTRGSVPEFILQQQQKKQPVAAPTDEDTLTFVTHKP
ncbi:hypothetical protein D5085_04500 [Ectothiorhodospiraceae bacterium BW-2]|nr:hypothetical protein D5085_04500 [Ectothiorhodospiraceae bacterium BW-2]